MERIVARTEQPRRRSSRTTCAPSRPLPPATKTCMPPVRMHIHAQVCDTVPACAGIEGARAAVDTCLPRKTSLPTGSSSSSLRPRTCLRTPCNSCLIPNYVSEHHHKEHHHISATALKSIAEASAAPRTCALTKSRVCTAFSSSHSFCTRVETDIP